jgi:hypothetical protein
MTRLYTPYERVHDRVAIGPVSASAWGFGDRSREGELGGIRLAGSRSSGHSVCACH